MKYKELTKEPHLSNNYIEMENVQCTMTKVDDASETRSNMQVELITQEKCDPLTNMNFVYSVKTETSEDFDSSVDTKDIINQIIDENGEVWPKEVFFTSWDFHSVKMEMSEDYRGKSECTKTKKNDENEMIYSFQMDPISPKCELPKNLDSQKHHLYDNTQKGLVQQHIKSTNQHRKCDFCDYSSSVKQNLLNHMKSVHLKIKDHKCSLCDYSSSKRVVLQKHMKSIHLKLKYHKCDLCDYSTSRKFLLQEHMESIHLKLNNHKCDLCDYSTSRKFLLQEHMGSIHLKLKNHKCDLCDYSTSLKSNLQRHMKSVHLKIKNHKCGLCDYSSSEKGALQKHIKLVHSKLKDHKCGLCDFSSSRKDNLQQHMKSVHLKLKS